MKWLFLSIVFISTVIYEILDRYFEYKKRINKNEIERKL